MSGSCLGLGPAETAACEACHVRGGTWVIRPDGSMICSVTTSDASPGRPMSASDRKALAFLGGIALVFVVNWLYRQYRPGEKRS